MTGLNWYWITVGASAPLVVALILSFPFWWKEQPLFGNLVGTAVLFGSAFALIMREYVEIDRIVRACLDAGDVACFPEPSAFTRFAVYAFIGLLEVFVLFSYSLRVEKKQRDRDYAPEWR